MLLGISNQLLHIIPVASCQYVNESSYETTTLQSGQNYLIEGLSALEGSGVVKQLTRPPHRSK